MTVVIYPYKAMEIIHGKLLFPGGTSALNAGRQEAHNDLNQLSYDSVLCWIFTIFSSYAIECLILIRSIKVDQLQK